MMLALNRIFYFLALTIIVCGSISVHAQRRATVVMNADRTEMPVGTPFRLQIRADIEGGDGHLELPDLSPFEIRRRQVSRPISFDFGQQRAIRSTISYTFLLVAHQPGRYELKPAKAIVGNQTVQSDPLSIVVGGQNTPVQSSNPSQTATIAIDGADVDEQAFIRTVADIAEPYVGQQVTISVYLYSRTPITNVPQVIREPSSDGFWTHDLLTAQRTLEARVQRIQGIQYRVYLIRRFAAFPSSGRRAYDWSAGNELYDGVLVGLFYAT